MVLGSTKPTPQPHHLHNLIGCLQSFSAKLVGYKL